MDTPSSWILGVTFRPMDFPPGSNFSLHSSGSNIPLWIPCPILLSLDPTSLQHIPPCRNLGLFGAFPAWDVSEMSLQGVGSRKHRENKGESPGSALEHPALNLSASRVARLVKERQPSQTRAPKDPPPPRGSHVVIWVLIQPRVRCRIREYLEYPNGVIPTIHFGL